MTIDYEVAGIVYPKFRWFVLVTMIMVKLASDATMIAPTVFAGEISKSLHVDLGVVLMVSMSLFVLCIALSSLAGGFLIDKIGMTPVWVFGMGTSMILSLLYPVVGQALGGYAVIRILQGLVNGPIVGGVAYVCANWFKMNERVMVSSAFAFSSAFGTAAGMTLGPAFFNLTHSWQWGLAGVSILPCAGFILSLIVLFGPKAPAVVDQQTNAPAGKKMFTPALKKVLCYNTFIILTLICFCDSWSAQAYTDMMNGFYAVDPPVGLGLGPMGAGARMAFAPFGLALAAIVTPLIMEKFLKGDPKILISIGCGLGGLLVVSVRFMRPEYTTALVLIPFLISTLLGFVNPAVFGYVAKYYPPSMTGRIGGLMMGFAIIGGFLGLTFSSIFLSITMYYWLSMNTLMIIAVAAAVLVWFLKPPKGSEVSQETNSNKAESL